MQAVYKKNALILVFSLLVIVCVLCTFMFSLSTKAEEDYVDVNIYSCGGEIQINQEINGDADHYYFFTSRGGVASAGFYVHPPEGKVFDGVYTERDGKGELITGDSVGYTDPAFVNGDRSISGFYVLFEHKVDEDSDFYINWVDPIYITFDANGGVLKTKDGEVQQLTLAFTPNRRNFIDIDHYIFSQDFASKDGETTLEWSTDPYDDTGVFYSDFVFTKDSTVYAVYKPVEYTISITNGVFDKSGNQGVYQTQVNKGDSAKLSFTLYDYYNNLNSGRFFGGIYTAPKGTGSKVFNECTYNADDGTYYFQKEYTPTESMNLYIYWCPGISLKLDSNGGVFKDGNTTHVQNRAADVVWHEVREDSNYNVPTRKGFTFSGWHTKQDAAYGFSLDDYLASASTTLYAVWEENPHDHVEEIIKGKEPTCTENGLTDGKRCSECGEILVAQEVIDAKGHQIDYFEPQAPTCTEVGFSSGSHCSVCGEVFEAVTEIPAKGHTEKTVKGNAPTCTESGLTDGVKCSECGEWIKKQEVIPAKGHTEVVVKGKDATCTESGLTEGKKCSVCGEWIEPQEEISTTGHKGLNNVAGYAATCTESGLTDGVRCSVCNEWITKQESIPAKGHTKEAVKGLAATCTEEGLTDGEKCSVCGEWLNKQKVIPAKGHKKETVKGYAATCTKDGLTDGEKCSICGEWVTKQETIKASGHKFEKGVCTVCGEKDPNYKPEPAPTPVSKQNGLADSADSNGDWWFYKDGKIDKTHNGVDQNKYGWWRVENGKVNFNAQGIYQNSLGWWKTTNGKVTFKETGVFQNSLGWWRVEDSKVNFKAQSVYQNQFGWWKTTNGKVTFKENGLFKNQHGTWKVENSKVNFNFNGKYQGKTIKNGKVV